MVGLFCSNLTAGGTGMEKQQQKWLTARLGLVPMISSGTEAPHRHGELFSALCHFASGS